MLLYSIKVNLKALSVFNHFYRLAPLVYISILECYAVQNHLECSVNKKRVKRSVYAKYVSAESSVESSSHIRYLVITNAMNLNSQ